MRQSNCAVFGSNLRLDAPPGFSVAGDHNGAFHGDPVPGQFLVIGHQAVIDVNQGRRYVSVGRVCIVSGELLVFLL